MQRFNLIYEFYPQPELGRFRAEIISDRGLWAKAHGLGAMAVEEYANQPPWESQIRCVGEEPGEIITVHDTDMSPHVVSVRPYRSVESDSDQYIA